MALRETIESVVIAFVLAFLFRTFAAEAFVIPTGSMATTLMGRHKDVRCVKCGYPFQVNASRELKSDGSVAKVGEVPVQVESCVCPMCRYQMNIGPDNPQGEKYPSYTGDRILVGKAAYELEEPRRWDVAVFKFPGDAQTNYIKRLVGLPHETIRIEYGNIYVKGDGEADFHIERKPPEKMLAMLHPVFDNAYMSAIAKIGWPQRWQPVASDSGASGWKTLEDLTTFQCDGAGGETCLRYSHRVPPFWQNLRGISDQRVPPQLISDFCGYNTERDMHSDSMSAMQLHWVGDLALECELDSLSDSGRIVFELVKGGRKFQCRVNLADGAAEMAIPGADMENFRPAAQTPLRGRGRHKVMFSNVDNQLRLFVDGKLVEFGGADKATCYPELGNTYPNPSDLAPAGICAEGASVRVSGLKVLRDIYYIDAQAEGNHIRSEPALRPEELASPQAWSRLFTNPYHVDLALSADQFLALGDNSAQSKDSRLWGTPEVEYYVSRDLLTGKAFFIYWPHSWDSPIPFFPNFARMGFVR